jgi:hypothetical protein
MVKTTINLMSSHRRRRKKGDADSSATATTTTDGEPATATTTNNAVRSRRRRKLKSSAASKIVPDANTGGDQLEDISSVDAEVANTHDDGTASSASTRKRRRCGGVLYAALPVRTASTRSVRDAFVVPARVVKPAVKLGAGDRWRVCASL